MRGKLMFLGGLAAGFVIGARAGREKYEELVRTAKKVKESPTVQEAAGVVQEQANRLYHEEQGQGNRQAGQQPLRRDEPRPARAQLVGAQGRRQRHGFE